MANVIIAHQIFPDQSLNKGITEMVTQQALISKPWNFTNTLRPRQNGRHFPDDIFKWIFLNENVWISINISLKFVPRGPIHNIPTLVQVMAWRRPGDKPLSKPMIVILPTHICVTRPQWVNWSHWIHKCYTKTFQWGKYLLQGIFWQICF